MSIFNEVKAEAASSQAKNFLQELDNLEENLRGCANKIIAAGPEQIAKTLLNTWGGETIDNFVTDFKTFVSNLPAPPVKS